MTIDFQAVLAEFLYASKQLALPGIGTINLEEKQPVILKDRNMISGPSVELVFTPIESDPQKLVDYVSGKLGYDKKKVSISFLHWISRLKKNLSKDQKVDIGALGSLELTSDGTPSFNAGKRALDGLLQLPSISATPIVYTAASEPTIISEVEQNETIGSEDRTVPRLLLALLLLVLLWLLTWPLLFPSNDSSNNSVTNSPEIENNESNLDPHFDTALAGNLGVDDNDEQEHESSDIDVEYTEDIEEELNKGAAIEESETKTEEYKEETISDDVDNPQIEKVFQKECIIILGSFRKTTNAQTMLDKIKAEGYTTYSEMSGPNHRVGVRFDCLTKDLYTELFQLRGDFSKDAWVLKYK